jgi:hypothetical protein
VLVGLREIIRKMEIENKETIGTLNDLAKDTESIKLIKNSKGYNWEIKILSTDIERLKKLDFEMIQQWGGTVNVD